jgi:hypothetical protein
LEELIVRFFALLSLPFVIAIGLGAAGCGDGGETGSTAGGCFDYTKFDGMTPTVGFAKDVLPIFSQSCALSNSCHGDQSGPATQPYLGPMGGVMPSASELSAIFAANVNADSLKATGMKIVVPGKPDQSFMMFKVDNALSCPGVTCKDAACGTSMPQASATLPAATRDTIRRWISQGAKND